MRHLLHADASAGPYSGSRNNPGDDTAASSDRPASKLAVWWGDMIAVGPGRIRTANPDGTPGHPARCRWATHANFTPPYTFGGRILIRSHDGPLHPTYGMVFHPVHVSNLNNLWIRFGTSDNQCVLGVEVNDVEVRIRYHPFPVPEFGRWHDWAIHVDAGHAVTFTWNGRQVARWSDERIDVFAHGPVGMRLDGFDAELDGTYVDDGRPEPEGDAAVNYIYGYGSTRLTAAQLATRATWARLHPEMRRRLLEMFNAARAAGVDLGIGQGWRSSAQQEQTFRDRHYVVASGGCCSFDGKRWQLRSGMAHAAPPGRSYHEETTAAGEALAADLVSSDQWRWMNANAHRFQLRHFANVNNEPWHVQPVEIPNARSAYVERLHPLNLPAKIPDPVKPPPLPPFEEDDMQRIARGPDGQTIWRGNGVIRKHVKTQREYDIIRLDSATGNGPRVTTIHGAELPASLAQVPQVEAAAIESLGAVLP